jgi:hypothetical protein
MKKLFLKMGKDIAKYWQLYLFIFVLAGLFWAINLISGESIILISK